MDDEDIDYLASEIVWEIPHEIEREYLVWGTYGPKGTDPLTYISVSDMDTEHIVNILKDTEGGKYVIEPKYEKAFKREINYRQENDTYEPT